MVVVVDDEEWVMICCASEVRVVGSSWIEEGVVMRYRCSCCCLDRCC